MDGPENSSPANLPDLRHESSIDSVLEENYWNRLSCLANAYLFAV